MDKQEMLEKLNRLVGDYLSNQGLELVDLIFRFEGRDLFLRVLVDRPKTGISLDECANLNRQLGDRLDSEELIADRYVLEVSSPGLDRPLTRQNDFIRHMNKQAVFFLKQPVNGKIEWTGAITGVNNGIVDVSVGDSVIGIPLESIIKAKLVI